MSDELLYIVSSQGRIKRQLFLEYLSILSNQRAELEGDADQRFGGLNTERAMDALGYIDVCFDEHPPTVYAAPRVLVVRPERKFPLALLIGRRNPDTVERLNDACERFDGFLEPPAATKEYPFIPDRVMVRTDEMADLRQIAASIEARLIEAPPAARLASFSCSLDEYLLKLSWREVSDLNWSARRFNPATLVFVLTESASGMTLIEFVHPYTGLSQYKLRDGCRTADVARDWGRYAVLRQNRMNVLGYTDFEDVLVPVGAILPRLLARSLALCSGYAPLYLPAARVRMESPERRGFYRYQQVPRAIAELVATKLGQQLKRAMIIVEGGVNHA